MEFVWDSVLKAMLGCASARLWDGGSQSPSSATLTSQCCVATSSRLWTDRLILFTYPRWADHTNTPIVLTQEYLCLFPVHTYYKSPPYLTLSPPSSSAAAVEKEREKLHFHKGSDKHIIKSQKHHSLHLRDLEDELLKYDAHFVRHSLKIF